MLLNNIHSGNLFLDEWILWITTLSEITLWCLKYISWLLPTAISITVFIRSPITRSSDDPMQGRRWHDEVETNPTESAWITGCKSLQALSLISFSVLRRFKYVLDEAVLILRVFLPDLKIAFFYSLSLNCNNVKHVYALHACLEFIKDNTQLLCLQTTLELAIRRITTQKNWWNMCSNL